MNVISSATTRALTGACDQVDAADRTRCFTTAPGPEGDVDHVTT